MPKINRPPKALGTFNYADEVAQGKLDIIDAEIDLDFNTLYTGINKLDGSNFDPNPTTKITCAQLNLTGCVTTTDIVSLDANKLFGFLPHTIGGVFVHGDSLQGGTVQSAALHRGASTWAPAQTPNRTDVVTITTTDQSFVEAVFTSRSGPVLMLAVATVLVHPVNANVGGGDTVVLQLRQDGTSGVADGEVLAQTQLDPIVNAGAVGFATGRAAITLVCPYFASSITPLTPPNVRIKLCLRVVAGDSAISQHTGSRLAVVELA